MVADKFRLPDKFRLLWYRPRCRDVPADCATYFGAWKRDFGALKRDFGAWKRDFGALKRDFGAWKRDFGAEGTNGGTARRDIVGAT